MSEAQSIRSILNEMTDLLKQHDASYYFKASCEFAPIDNKLLEELKNATGVDLQPDLCEFLTLNTRPLPFIRSYQAIEPKWLLENLNSCKSFVEDGTFPQFYQRIVGWKDRRWNSKRFQRVYWSPSWIAFAEDSCGNSFCVDHAPGESGQLWQILEMEFQDAQGPYLSSFPNLRTFLKIHVELLRQKRFDLNDGHIEYHEIMDEVFQDLLSQVQDQD